MIISMKISITNKFLLFIYNLINKHKKNQINIQISNKIPHHHQNHLKTIHQKLNSYKNLSINKKSTLLDFYNSNEANVKIDNEHQYLYKK